MRGHDGKRWTTRRKSGDGGREGGERRAGRTGRVTVDWMVFRRSCSDFETRKASEYCKCAVYELKVRKWGLEGKRVQAAGGKGGGRLLTRG